MLKTLAGEVTVTIDGTDYLVIALDDDLTLNAIQEWANEHNLSVSKALQTVLRDALYG